MRKGTPWILATTLIATTLQADEVIYSYNDHWKFVGEFLYMRRKGIQNHDLVKGDKGRKIDNKGLAHRLGYEPGFRGGVTYMEDPKTSFEANFLYLQPWSSEKKAHGDADLYTFSNPSYDYEFSDASAARAKYHSSFWDIELNYWHHFTPRRVDYFALSGIIGLRYFHWDESFKLEMIRPPDESSYDIRTHNHIFSVQLGLDFEWNPTRYMSWDLIAKFGGMADHADQRTFLGEFDNTVALRDYLRRKWQIGFFGDLAAQLAFQFKEHFNIHFGYEILLFSGVALAPDQIVKKTSHEEKVIKTNGSAYIHGLYAGLTVAF